MTPVDSAPLVLVVDDEEVVRRVACLLLENAGFRVVTARSGAEAVAVVRAEASVDVVLLDVMLPDRGGGEIARDLRGLRPELPIVVSSGYDEGTVADRVGEIPGARFIRKPYAAAQLVETLSDAIGAQAPAG
jgi:two-component system cell cycle sensor histidine kinase/response regulator CckA